MACAAGFLLTAGAALAQSSQEPAVLGQPMQDFTLPSLQGPAVKLSELRGKNVLLVFPRGRYNAQTWRHICHYSYLELADLDRRENLRKRYNLEIVYVLPYDKATVAEWAAMFVPDMKEIEHWKNTPDSEADAGKRPPRDFARRIFPQSFTFKDGEAAPLPFPVPIDGGHVLSLRLGLFTTQWGGTNVGQNIPTVYVLDGDQKVRFKYISQDTFDRPNAADMAQVIDRLLPAVRDPK